MPHSQTRLAAELPIALDRAADAPLPAQLAAALREAIDQGTLRAGEALPATRGYASRLGVARGVVVNAYEQLVAEGYLLAGHGRGTLVHPELAAPHPSTMPSRGHTRSQTTGTHDSRQGRELTAAQARVASTGMGAQRTPGPLAPGVPDTSGVDSPAWRAAWRHAVTRAHVQAPELGDPRLREEIADHLRRMRGTQRSAADIIVTAGARDGLELLLTSMAAGRGRSLTVGVEDPGYPSLRRVAARHATRIVGLPVDPGGVDPRALTRAGLDAIIVTPSHQYPMGGSLPLSRRRELLDWAARAGVVIVEDDYDGELRHTGSPMPALAALDDEEHGVVALLGTFSKTVSPALSAGYLLAPAALRRLLEPVRRELGGPVSAVVQSALAEYLATGALRRHTARMRRRYAARRDTVVERLQSLPGVTVRPMSGGLHIVLEFTSTDAPGPSGYGFSEANREARALEHTTRLGLGAVPLSGYWQGGSSGTHSPRRDDLRRLRESEGEGVSIAEGGARSGRYGLVIGTGGADTHAFEQAVAMLRRVLAD